MKKIISYIFALAICITTFSNLNLKPVNAQMNDEGNMIIKTPYTIDQLYEMPMSEYYEKLFPETYENLTKEEIEHFNTITYGDLKEEEKSNKVGKLQAATELDLYRSSSSLLGFRVNSYTIPATTIDYIEHTIKLVDHKGQVWLIQKDNTSNKKNLFSTGTKGCPPGNYRLEVGVYMRKSGYYDTSYTATGNWVNF